MTLFYRFPWPRVYIALSILALCVGGWLRLDSLDEKSLWSDELFSVGVASLAGQQLGQSEPEIRQVRLHGLVPEDDFWTWKLADQHPPLYEMVLSGWMDLFGNSDWAIRLPSALFGILLMGSAWLYGRRNFELTAYYSVLLALSPWLIFYAQEARSYSLVALLSGLLVWTVASQRASPGSGCAYRLSNTTLLLITLLIFTHYYGVLFSGALCAVVSFFHWRERRYREILRLSIPFVLLLPYLWLARLGVMMKVGSTHPSFAELIHHLYKTAVATVDLALPGLLVWMVLAGVVLSIIHRVRPLWATPPEVEGNGIPYQILVLWLLVFVLLVGVATASAPFFNPRYLIFASPLLLLLFSAALTRLQWHRAVKLLLVAVMGMVCVQQGQGIIRNSPGEDYRSAARYVADHYQPGDQIVSSWKPNMIYHLHYLSRYIGPQVRDSMTSYFSDEDIRAGCEAFVPARTGVRVFFIYHPEHVNQVAAFETYCAGKGQRVAQVDFFRLSVVEYITGPSGSDKARD